jgi:hypothetical protein
LIQLIKGIRDLIEEIPKFGSTVHHPFRFARRKPIQQEICRKSWTTSPAHDPVRDLNNSPAKTGLVLRLSGSIKGRAEQSRRGGGEEPEQKTGNKDSSKTQKKASATEEEGPKIRGGQGLKRRPREKQEPNTKTKTKKNQRKNREHERNREGTKNRETGREQKDSIPSFAFALKTQVKCRETASVGQPLVSSFTTPSQ